MTDWRLVASRGVDRILPIAVYAALPTWGAVSGPTYAPLIFGLAAIQCIVGGSVRRSFPVIDASLATLAAAFAAMCWISIAWSVAPDRSLSGALQITAILPAALVFLSARPAPEPIFRVLVVACFAGAAIVLTDAALGYPFQSFVSGRPAIDAATKYNRGLDHLALIVWPILAWLVAQGRIWSAMLLAASILLVLMLGAGLAGRVACLAAALAFAAASGFPRLFPIALPWAIGIFVALLPFAMRHLTDSRTALAPLIKPSGMHRLELWDFMTARALERPLLGWGFHAAGAAPIKAEELSGYIYVTGPGTYPHNQWIELWVETGAVGVAIGLAFALLILHRIRSMPAGLRPYGYAAFAAAMAVSCINFNIATDSWWAALAACGALFAMQSRSQTRLHT